MSFNLRTFQLANLLTILALFFASPAPAQVATGTPAFGSFAGGPEVINLGNLNAHWAIPVLHKPGRGVNFTYDLGYDSSVWYPVGASGNQTWQPVGNWGWAAVTSQVLTGQISFSLISTSSTQVYCGPDVGYVTNYTYTYGNWGFLDPFGLMHSFTGTTQLYSPMGCNLNSSGGSGFGATATDGSGYQINAYENCPTSTSCYAVSKDGTAFYSTGGSGGNKTERNGNLINVDASGHFYDTLSSTTPVLTVAGTAPANTTLTYTAPSGASAVYTIKYTTSPIQTNFGCSNIGEYGANGNLTANLVTEIDLPDGSKYSFTYEQTPGHSTFVTGRLAKVTLPTGGSITYTYTAGGLTGSPVGSHDPIVCADGSAAGLQRALYDGTNTNTWTYARNQISGPEWTTTISDPTTPTANQTLIYFQKDSATTNNTNNFYETWRQAFQGSASGTPLRQWTTCYNGSTSGCTTAAVSSPIAKRFITDQYGSSGLQCAHYYFYNSVGGLSEQDDFDYGSSGQGGSLLRKLLITYASLGNNITAFKQTVTTCNGTGSSSSCAGPSGGNTGTVVAQTNYNYDEGSVTAPANQPTPQHTSVTGSRGNLTSINYPVSGLTSHLTYYDTGTPNVATDVNGGQTTYTYGPLSATCGNAFPTGISEAITTLTQSYAWNCIGGVMTQLTDENGKNSSVAYTDPYYWRPSSTTDQASVTSNICYAALTSAGCPSTPSATQIETYLNFNSGSSTADSLVTLDALGRVHVQQTRQGPAASSSNFDSVETDYDALGRPSRTTTLYSGTAGQTTSPTYPATTTTYDPLSRPMTITDAGGGTATYTYSPTSSDVLIAIGPIPTGSGENLKQRQYEYNSIGWLTSVCEITSTLPGNGTCAQSTSTQPTGYWTKYSYDALGDLLTMTQNAQAASASQQTRTFAYDAMGRLTSEINPEMNQTAISYTYDTIASGSCAGTYSGDLVKRVDAIGNITCYTYDSLHRPLSRTYTTSTPTVSTPNKCFVYDAAIDGNTVTNTKGRLAEAYTTTSACSQTTLPSNTTDVAFGYSLRGEPTDAYEKTPHSGSTSNPYNHTTASFWASHALNTLGGPVIPALTYAVDPEGRTTTVSASGTNPVTSVTYNLYANPPQQKVTFGSGDSDTFNFDANTFRLTQYQFKVGTKTVTGAVNWNANGSLGSLNITDQFNSSNTQNCSYTADDLARINKGDCGTIWGQTFSYDAFGNISKTKIAGSGATSFNPTYQSSPSITNRIASVGGTNASYDANGNSLNDTFRSFTWDAENRPVTIASVSLTYDALGRMVEQSVSSSTNTEIVYAPLGGKLSLMNGLSLVKAFAPLTGGATAVYTSASGPAYYRHTDHLGSSRFASTPSQTLYSDTAYSPFGEPYASSGAIDNSFTGQNQDTLAGLYDFLYREHDPNQGRWTRPDPAGLAAVNITNPQSWNRYSYVLNNPLNLVDPYGMNDCPDGKDTCGDDPSCPDCGAPGVDIFGSPFYGYGNPANGCDLGDITNCADQEDNRAIASMIAAENLAGFTAAAALFQSMNDVTLLQNGQDPTTFNYPARTGQGGIQVFIVGGCVAFRDGLGNWYNWGCSGGDWISLTQVADAIRSLPNAILSARQNLGRSANDIKIQNLANQVTYQVEHPMSLCEFGDFAALTLSIAVYPEAAVPKWVAITVWGGSGAWGIKQLLAGGCSE